MYFSKFSKKCYTNCQKLAIYVLMQKLHTTTRGIISWLRSNPLACARIGLRNIPVHTTIVRFVHRIPLFLHTLLGIRRASIVAVDATGFELEKKSYYYRNITQDRFNHKRKTKRFLKLSIAIDAEKQLILSCKIRKKARHDTIDFKELLKELDVDYLVADKGYDSHELRKFVVHALHAQPHIPYRKISGRKRIGKTIPKFNEQIYHQRSKVETVFSVIKRKYGSVLRARSVATQRGELISKLLAYNIDRTVNYLLLILEDCTRARNQCQIRSKEKIKLFRESW